MNTVRYTTVVDYKDLNIVSVDLTVPQSGEKHGVRLHKHQNIEIL